MSATDFGWLILLFPLVGSVVIALGWRASSRPDRWLDHGDRARSRARSGCSRTSSTAPRKARTLTSTLYDYATSVGLEIDMNIYVDPLACVMCLVVTGVSMLIHLYSVALPGLRPRLRGSSATSTSSSSRCCCWFSRATSSC